MARRYAVTFRSVAVTAAQELFELSLPSDIICKILYCSISQSSDAGDAQDEQLSITMRRQIGGSVGSGGATSTPAPLATGDTASSVTARINDTSLASGGQQTYLLAESFNVRGGFVYMPTPEMQPTFAPSEIFIVELEGAPADSLTMDGTLIFEEMG